MIYDALFVEKRIFAEQLLRHSRFSRIMWIAAPDVTMACARFRFGDAYVDSGSQRFHLQLAEKSFAAMFDDTNPSNWLIRHPEKYLTRFGFTQNRFAMHQAGASDIHASPKFYESALMQLFDLLARPDSGFHSPGLSLST